MEYNKVIQKKFLDTIFKYGIIEGSNKIFFIKIGQYGEIKGMNDKYLKIAYDINEKYGFSVVVSNNPTKGINSLDNDMKVVEDFRKEMGFSDYDIYYMGYSNGGLIGSLYGTKYPQIKRMLLVNTPIHSDTFHNLKDFEGEFITFVYGDLDRGFKYVPYLFNYLDEKIGLEIIEGADHHFNGKEDIFISLPEKYLFADIEKRSK